MSDISSFCRLYIRLLINASLRTQHQPTVREFGLLVPNCGVRPSSKDHEIHLVGPEIIDGVRKKKRMYSKKEMYSLIRNDLHAEENETICKGSEKKSLCRVMTNHS